jgi:hypothetical protein
LIVVVFEAQMRNIAPPTRGDLEKLESLGLEITAESRGEELKVYLAGRKQECVRCLKLSEDGLPIPSMQRGKDGRTNFTFGLSHSVRTSRLPERNRFVCCSIPLVVVVSGLLSAVAGPDDGPETVRAQSTPFSDSPPYHNRDKNHSNDMPRSRIDVPR